MDKEALKKANPPGKNYRAWVLVTIVNVILLVCSGILFFFSRKEPHPTSPDNHLIPLSTDLQQESPLDNPNNLVSLIPSPGDASWHGVATSTSISTPLNSIEPDGVKDIPVTSEEECTSPVWCNVPMPSKSHFKFDPPTDLARWKRAQILASGNDQVLLREVIKQFPHPFNYLDGDRSFRRIHYLVDMFVDNNKKITDLTVDSKISKRTIHNGPNRRLGGDETQSTDKNPDAITPDMYRLVPDNYDFRYQNRAPLVQIGFGLWKKDSNSFFSGNRVGYSGIDRGMFLKEWNSVKDKINTPFIALCEGNENWGMLSTMFPNRTAAWGSCCNTHKDKLLLDFLNHEKTLALLINQHSNISHPKLLTLPRGLPLTWAYTEKLVWDSQRFALNNIKKERLLFSASSKWGKRPQMLQCISDKMSPEDFEGHVKPSKLIPPMSKTDRRVYYEKLATAKFGLALPGLGYDCFKTWELMTMGTIIIIEKGVGLDRSLWRLPALLVDDFDDITPELLRSAYIEAMYRAQEFEYIRLTQGYWYSVISNVSYSRSTRPLLDAFPMHAEDSNFMRPREPFACAVSNTCGHGTKRIPKKSC